MVPPLPRVPPPPPLPLGLTRWDVTLSLDVAVVALVLEYVVVDKA